MYRVSWEECVASYTRNQPNKSAVSTDAERGKNQFNLKTTDIFPFNNNHDAAFKEGYLCAVEAISNSFCGHCGLKNKLNLKEYTSRKVALEYTASCKLAPSLYKSTRPGPNFNAFNGMPIPKGP